MYNEKPLQSEIRTMDKDEVWEKLIYFPILSALLVTHVALKLMMLAIILKPMPVPHPLYVYSASTLSHNPKVHSYTMLQLVTSENYLMQEH
jgi:hypothetical protein